MFRVHRKRLHEEMRKTLKLELQIRSSLYRLTTLLKTMDNELSLLPVSVSISTMAHHRLTPVLETAAPLSRNGHSHAEAP